MNHTTDQICRGELMLRQPARGYRFNVDALILAHFAGRFLDEGGGPICDLGAGCGVVGLLLAARNEGCAVTLVELQAELAALARQNIMLNGLSQRARLVEQDLRALQAADAGAPARLVVSNPPFFRLDRGRPSPDPQLAMARHEVALSLQELVAAAARLQEGGAGQLAMIHAADRRTEVLTELRLAGLEPRLVRDVAPSPEGEPVRFLVLAGGQRSAGPPQQEPALVIHDAPGVYSAEMKRVLREPA